MVPAMNDVEFFHQVLDQHPDDHGARLLLAEVLSAQGDALAEGIRWIAQRGKYPLPDSLFANRPHTWDWWSMKKGWNNGIDDNNEHHDRIDPELMQALDQYQRKSNWSGDCAYCEYPSRRQAEAALCRALAALADSSPTTF